VRKVGTTFLVEIPLKVSFEIGCMVDDLELDLSFPDFDFSTFEFLLCNNNASFPLQQIKKALVSAS